MKIDNIISAIEFGDSNTREQAKKDLSQLDSLLTELSEYFDDKADVEGDSEKNRSNKEAKFLSELNNYV